MKTGDFEYGFAVNDGEVIVVKPEGFKGFRAFHKDYPEVVGSGEDLPAAARDVYRQIERAKKPAKAQEAQPPHDLTPEPKQRLKTANTGVWATAPDNWPAVIYPPLHEGGIHERDQFVCIHNFKPVCGYGASPEAALEDMIKRLQASPEYEALKERAKHVDRIRPIPEIQGFHDLLNFLLPYFEDAGNLRLLPDETAGMLYALCWVLGHKNATQYIYDNIIKKALENIDFEGENVTAFGEPFDMRDLSIFHSLKKDGE